MTFQEILNGKKDFVATGIIKNITGEADKIYKSGWQGSSAEITLIVNNTTQKIKVFGGTGKNEFPINVFLVDGEGKILKDDKEKAVRTQIKADEFDPKKHVTFDTREVMKWGERDSEGKPTKISYISELTEGRFANSLLEHKEEIIGKRVGIRGTFNFRPTQKYDKIEVNMSVNRITLLDDIDDTMKHKPDEFILNLPMVINKTYVDKILDNLDKDGNGVLHCYVPVYHKYVDGEKENKKGRNVFVSTPITLQKNGFLGVVESIADLPLRVDLFKNRLNYGTNGTDFVMCKAGIRYKSGVVERQITINDLLQDPIYGGHAKKIMAIEDEDVREVRINNFIEMYKVQNPMTVKGEFVQKIDFGNIIQVKNSESGLVEDVLVGINPQVIEFYTLEKIKTEDESMEQKKEIQSNPVPKVKTTYTQPAPPAPEIESYDADDFPF